MLWKGVGRFSANMYHPQTACVAHPSKLPTTSYTVYECPTRCPTGNPNMNNLDLAARYTGCKVRVILQRSSICCLIRNKKCCKSQYYAPCARRSQNGAARLIYEAEPPLKQRDRCRSKSAVARDSTVLISREQETNME